MTSPTEIASAQPSLYNKAAYRLVLAGLVLIVFGLTMAIGTMMLEPDGHYAVSFGSMLVGGVLLVRGLFR